MQFGGDAQPLAGKGNASEILIYQGENRNARLMGFADSFRIPVSDTQAYKQFAGVDVVPMIEAAAKLMAPSLAKEVPASRVAAVALPKDIMSSGRWTKEQLKLAFHLYCQLPFGKLHSRNAEIIRLAELIGRTPSAVAMKLVNFASLDPSITNSGRSGLGNASALDRQIWDEFQSDWEGLAMECLELRRLLGGPGVDVAEAELADEEALLVDYSGETRRVFTEQRVKQNFFRRSVLASYRGRCCMSKLSDSRLLVASHIVPWSKDKANRLNPSNGLCLSAIHDRAFDKGLISLTDDFRILVSDDLKRQGGSFIDDILLPLEGRSIEHHRESLFVDNRGA